MKNKYIFGGVIAVVFLGMMIYLFTKSNIQYESDFAKVMSSERTIKATGTWVKEKNYEVNKSERTFVFYMKDAAGHEMKVIYSGTIPNNFESAQSIVVTGLYKNGNFHAKDILTKCPSKYQDKQNAAANS
ncbi:MAG: cytochrome C biogenesis protein [Ignavibacteria bacterium CG_4_8_14_3_um_filter_37_9]|nr:cytochrome c maturation protein CcmE [Ignavibacteria bacterium]OIO22939.1 MAG: cytochrome C biogenesis protein [Ignavibacteria bacterium CG1_02_37_35]PIP76936.1 MAG: cytochrome C biogenesis protein [Ignavibacteria bacterium CG22_combo_CG10-13_8_21_14_all_37_15]PIS46355.1 MAG: cytochrome C biogenesis protein [Ignavibacteria bacterium CG08_land_8_20_14_0_20_37_9]PIW99165.1 MAG: cytochrome C biogenesis protein [Ignavibacteria bacterium CG_4_8_14_3_um_filter_37_9]PIX93445.1 MAG: cytochrome C bi